MEYVVQTTDVTKEYHGKIACDHINMNIKKGEIYGFIGKNGAGKTTLMKMLLGLANPTAGSIKLFESDELTKQRRKIGSLIENPGLYKNCTAYENMKRFSMLSGGTDEEINELLDMVGLSDSKNKLAGKFSLGMKQRLGIAIAMLGNPELLVLDEPINGLDPEGIRDIRDAILRLNKEKGVTVLISSHLLDELAKITTKYGIINRGVLVEEVDSHELMERCKSGLSIAVSDVNKAEKILKANKVLEEGKYSVDGQSLTIRSNYKDSASITRMLVKAGVDVLTSKEVENGFEEYFIERIGA